MPLIAKISIRGLARIIAGVASLAIGREALRVYALKRHG
jgi:hypothetical protein